MGCAVYNMLGIDETQSLLNPALSQTFLNLRRDVDKCPSGGYFEPEFFVVTFHCTSLHVIIDIVE